MDALVASHRAFLSFVERRVENPAVAEEILQSAFVKSLEKGALLREGESAVAWFYRLLRNAIVDHYRRRGVERRGLAAEPLEAESMPAEVQDDARSALCACMGELLSTLKPEYADVLRQVDLEERSLAQVAASEGVTVNNATVRLHRARQALKRQLEASCGTCATHGCLDCTCRKNAR